MDCAAGDIEDGDSDRVDDTHADADGWVIGCDGGVGKDVGSDKARGRGWEGQGWFID